MITVRILCSRVRGFLARPRHDAELHDEVRDHLERLVEDYVRRGLSPTEARAAARREFGGIDQMTEQYRDQRSFRVLEELVHDVRDALRGFRRSPGFVAAVVLSLAAGVGVNAVVFTVLNAVLLTTLPVRHAEDLVVVAPQAIGPTAPAARFSYPAFQALQEAAPVPQTLAAVSRVARMYRRVDGQAEPQLTRVQLVSGEFFSVLGLSATQGRLLAPQDDRPGHPHPVAVLSHAMWLDTFGADPTMVGRTLTVNGVSLTIVGVAPAGFSGVWLESPADLWIPLTLQGEVRYRQNYSASNSDPLKSWIPQDGIRWLDMVGRVAEHDRARTKAALTTQFHRLVDEQADHLGNPAQRALLRRLQLQLRPFGQGFSNVRATFALPLYVLFGMAALILLIACANVANLLIARAAARRREMAVKLSLGASRGRLIRQLLTESTMLAALAGLCGVLIAEWPARLLVRAALGGTPPFAVAVNARVIAFGMGAALLTVFLSGVAPAFRTTRVRLGAALGAAAARGARAQPSLQRILVAVQVALSLVLVVGAGLFVQTLRNYTRVNLGFSQEHVISVSLQLVSAEYPIDRMSRLSRALVASVESLPGVVSASTSSCGLADGCRDTSDITIDGYQPAPGEAVQVQEFRVSSRYFATTGMQLVEGREFSSGDREDAPKVAIVNRATARRFFGGRSPLGRRFGYGTRESGSGALDVEIVGVVEDARVNRVQSAPVPMVFYPMEQGADPEVVDVRTAGDPRALVADVRRTIADVAPTVPIGSVTTLSDRVARNLNQERLIAGLTAIFGTLAVALAALGLFGIMSYVVIQRTAEFGIRIALGATRARVLTAVLRDAMRVVVLGLAAGIPAVLLGSRLLTALLFGVTASDASTLAAAVAALAAVSVAAASAPAWRASRVDPVVALRSE